MKKPQITRITVGRLFNLGSYEHIRYELSVEIPEWASASQTMRGIEKIMEALNPRKVETAPSEIEIKREEMQIAAAEAMTDEEFRDYRNYRDYAGTREEVMQRLKEGLREKIESRKKAVELAKNARELLDNLGGAAIWKDAKLDWETDDDYS